MAGDEDFTQRLEKKVRQQIQSREVGFLLGAGSSYLSGKGYPLATELWPQIRDRIPVKEQGEIQRALDEGAIGLEQALDVLDPGGASDSVYRHLATDAIAEHFGLIQPQLDYHAQFLRSISQRDDKQVNVFSLNYDPLIERSAEVAMVRVLDGFQGHEHAYFDPGSFQHDIAVIQSSARGGARRRQIAPWVWLLKLHGSIGWIESADYGLRRTAFDRPIPEGARRLMIPPQHRKANDTVSPPYSSLWTEFRRKLVHGPGELNRLVTLGYGMADEHVNDVIEAALARTNFTLISAAKFLSDPTFERWSGKDNVIVITEDRCALKGEIGPGHPSLWAFESIVEELSR